MCLATQQTFRGTEFIPPDDTLNPESAHNDVYDYGIDFFSNIISTEEDLGYGGLLRILRAACLILISLRPTIKTVCRRQFKEEGSVGINSFGPG